MHQVPAEFDEVRSYSQHDVLGDLEDEIHPELSPL